MESEVNRRWVLAARPVGQPKRADFTWETTPVPAPPPGGLVVRNRFISLDPAMRGWMNEGRSYIPPVRLGEVMRALAAGEVVASDHPEWKPGDHAVGAFGVQDFAAVTAAEATRVDPSLAPLPVFISALGMPGLTAYFGTIDIGQVKAGETVVVSAASGAVGSVVGQIVKNMGARAVGIAGGAEKCRYVVETLGFDACIDYKGEDVGRGLGRHCPQGIDVYFDNVGGAILDHALARLRRHARVVICGAISQYNDASFTGPRNYMSLLINSARMEGFVVFDFVQRYPEAIGRLAQWRAEGRLVSREDIVQGLETFPETLLRLFTGENFGKLILAP